MGSPLDYFTDAVLRAPTIGSMLMCLSAALIGVLAFLRKQVLIGEALSHAAYPGVILGVMAAGYFMADSVAETYLAFWILLGALLTSLLGVWVIHNLESRWKIRSDSALCFVLSAFFGIGITLASRVQFSFTTLYKKSLTYLYGQAATMVDFHIVIYGILSLAIVVMVVLLYKELQLVTFDREYAKTVGISTRILDSLVLGMIVLAVVVGIRSVGVVLMSAMLIAPATAARQYTHRLSAIFVLAGFFGLISGFLGNYLSVEITKIMLKGSVERFSIPTGPMIVMVATLICLFSLLFAPERGYFIRLIRIANFRRQRVSENILKTIWRISPVEPVTLPEIKRYQKTSNVYLKWILSRLIRQGWVKKITKNTYQLTQEGEKWAAQIVRLHRLWEVYLTDCLGVGVERVHKSAEEMEHILTPELERELTQLLHDPKKDPHQQPIPPMQR